MADPKSKPQVSSERSDIAKGVSTQNKSNQFLNISNQVFARTQSTPLEDQKVLSFTSGGGSSLKSKLKVSGAVAFVPNATTSLANTFLSPGQPSSATSNTSSTYVANKGTLANGPETGSYQPTQSTSTFKPFIPSEQKPVTTSEASDKTTTSATTTTTVKPSEPTPPGSKNNLDSAATGAAGEKKGGSLKGRLKLSSSTFQATGDSAKPFVPQSQATPIPATQITTDKNAAPIGEWGKPITKAAEEKEKPKTGSPSKISLQAHKYDSKTAPQKNQQLEPILESKAESKEGVAPGTVKVEETKPVVENKKAEPVKEVKSPVKTEFTEVKPKQHKYGPRDTTKTTPTTVTDKVAPKVEPKKEQPKPVETKKAEEPVKTQEIKKPAEEPKKTTTPIKTEQEKPVEVKKAEEPKAEVKKPVEEPKPVKREEILVLSRVKFEEMIEDLKERLKDKRLPEALQVVKDRVIAAESSRQKQNYSSKGGKDSQKAFDRSDRERPLPVPEPSKQNQDGGFGIGRSDKTRSELPENQPAASSMYRKGLTDEERKKKEELNSNVNAWISGMKAEKDPEEVIKKKIKFNLNLITADNFDAVKDEILNIAADKVENCKRVAEFLIENAWTQKQYVNIYAKLCDYMGRSERLYFDATGKPDPKKKNSFKLHIMKQIQTVFEDDVNINLGFKKPFEELDEEDKVLYFAKKKQRILGNVSFIGELFLEKFLVIGLMRIITKSLLQRFLDEYATYQRAPEPKPKNRSFEDTLEGLLKFYEIIGKSVEDKEATKPVDKSKSAASVALFQKCIKLINDGKTPIESLPKIGEDELSLEDLFKIYNLILEEANISTRLDSLIKNLIFRRDQKWIASISKNQGPKTLDEIHREFEREQMEMERRADEYREELYNQPRYVPKQNARTEVVFQVASSKAKQQEESKLDTKSIEVDSNISFRPNRGKKGQEENKSASKKPAVNPEEIQNNLRDIYRLVQGEEIEDKQSPEEELKKLIAKIGGKEVLIYYFKTFYDGKIEDVKKRLFITDFLLDEKAIEPEDFLNAFQVTMNKMYDVACDFPGSEKYFATIILQYCRKLGNGTPFENINFSEDFYKRDDADLILEFYQDFFKALLKNLTTDFADLKGKISEEELKNFAKKIQIDNYDSFKSKI